MYNKNDDFNNEEIRNENLTGFNGKQEQEDLIKSDVSQEDIIEFNKGQIDDKLISSKKEQEREDLIKNNVNHENLRESNKNQDDINLTNANENQENLTKDDMELSNENLTKTEDVLKTEDKIKDEKIDEGSVDYNVAFGAKEYIYRPVSQTYSSFRDENNYNQNEYNEKRRMEDLMHGETGDTHSESQEESFNQFERRENYGSAYNEGAYTSAYQESPYNAQYNANTAKPSKARKPKRRYFSIVALVLVVSILSGTFGSFMTIYYYRNGNMSQNTNFLNNSNNQTVKIDLNEGTYYAAAVNEKNKNSVVGISTILTTYYDTFWGVQEREAQSIGSGIIVDSEGLILTNSHVIGDGQAKKITVLLTDGTSEEGKVLWFDKLLDLAVVKVNRSGLSASELGNSDELVVGEPVVAIGNPMSLSLNGTLTNGVISGLNRSITIDNTTIKPLIQTNASINPGNSGGPLFNAKGQVIGINTAKMSSAEGLGFAIPINVAIPVIQQLTGGGKVNNLYIGISGASVETYKERMNINLTAEYGIYIAEIIKDGPAYKAGLMVGDIIIAVGETQIREMDDLRRALYKYKEGESAQLTYLRNGNEETVEIKFEIMPEGY